MKKRIQAPLAALMASGQDQVLSLPSVPPGKYEQSLLDTIDTVRTLAGVVDPAYGDVAQQTQFIDVDNMTVDQRRAIIEALRKSPAANDIKAQSDEDVIDSKRARARMVGPNSPEGTNIVFYSSLQLKKYSLAADQYLFAHELAHKIQGPSEQGADRVAAQIIGAQNTVDAMAEIARTSPDYNDERNAKEEPHRKRHGTFYERALNIQKAFPEQQVDLSGFPKPTKDMHREDRKNEKKAPSSLPAAPPGF